MLKPAVKYENESTIFREEMSARSYVHEDGSHLPLGFTVVQRTEYRVLYLYLGHRNNPRDSMTTLD